MFKKLIKIIHAVVFWMWVISSCIVYSVFCIIFGLFARRISHIIGVYWCKHMAFVGGCKIHLKGIEKIDRKKNYIFTSNHQSFADIPVLFGFLPFYSVFIAKQSLFYIPFFGWGIAAMGHISINRSEPKKAKKSIDRAIESIKRENKSVFAFPEGTRSRTGEIGEFKLGIFSMAIQADIDVVPIAIAGTREIMPKGSYFFQSGSVDIHFGTPISSKKYTKSEKYKMSQEARQQIKDMLK
ncbi:MAG: 1-acyl-sn-glycerol-3-phosphate acyltransferase [Spirochaetales bacterium]|nr:1-acyl-sn-glycerol-3-phosphate acyltransferase [Spirochaetales bacterium]